MKGDFTRDTFNPQNHYQQVLMQQGRVQLDADWNEQSAIAVHRDETTIRDVSGACGGPADNAAFRIITDDAVLLEQHADPVAPVRQFALSAGRYYLKGLQCEAETPFLFSWQPDHRESTSLTEGNYLVYLDVWHRHLTMHEDASIREAALGGPDTATRLKTIWQVRAARLDSPLDPDSPTDDRCQQSSSEFDLRRRAALPRLAARTSSATSESDPCTVPASAGYRGLENQLYRVEIHTTGDIAMATFKWSRENGAVVTRITDSITILVNGVNVTRLTVVSTGPDENLGFKPGNIVEIIHDSEELEGIPGTLALVGDVDDATGRITLKQFGAEPMPVTISQESNPRLRRWEQFGHVAAEVAINGGFLALESGIEIQFDLPESGEFRTGDYWLIPARTASADAQSGQIEWPSGSSPVFLPPKGITHHYCRLGVVSINEAGTATLVSDCRCLWPPLTGVPRLFYVSGDGQEVMPDWNDAAGALVRLPHPLIVGMGNGHCLEQATNVRFDVVNTATNPSEGLVVAADGVPSENSVVVPLDATGLAIADFYPDRTNPTQQVVVRLLDSSSNPVSLPIIFNASLSIASRVAWQPGECAGLDGQFTVQDAIDRLIGQLSLHKVSGDAQTGAAENPLPQAITVLVANRCGPVSGVPVMFTPRDGDGSIPVDLPIITGPDGLAACEWILSSSPATQELEVSIADNFGFTTAPSRVCFTAQNARGDVASSGMHIKGVFSRSGPLKLGMRMAVNEMAGGLHIDCDHDVDPATVIDELLNRGEPTCVLTVEIPILPLTRENITLWGSDGLAGYSLVVLAADVQVNGNRISWSPSRFAMNGLNNVLNQMRQFGGRFGDRLLARLKLRGSFIWSLSGNRREQRLSLDGETFRLPEGENEFDLQLPSGDGRRGGDFETWFWLTHDQ